MVQGLLCFTSHSEPVLKRFIISNCCLYPRREWVVRDLTHGGVTFPYWPLLETVAGCSLRVFHRTRQEKQDGKNPTNNQNQRIQFRKSRVLSILVYSNFRFLEDEKEN